MKTKKINKKVLTFNRIVVPHSRAKDIIEDIISYMTSCEDSRDENGNINDHFSPDNILLTGDSGSGKTTLCEYITSKYPPYMKQNGISEVRITPCFYSVIGSPVTIKSVATSLLTSLGDPTPDRGNAGQMTTRVIKLLQTSQTNLIMLDEFHHLLNRKDISEVRNWLKTIMNRTRIPIVIAGLPECEVLIDNDIQVKRRFVMRHHLSDLAFSDPDQKVGEFTKYVNALLKETEQQLEYEQVFRIKSHDVLKRLYLATHGFPSEIAALIKAAIKHTLSQNKTTLELTDLEQVYPKLILARSLAKNLNPFNCKKYELEKLLKQVKI